MPETAQRWIVGSIAVLLICYTSFRAFSLSFTYDESNTVLYYAVQDYSWIFSRVPRATNHLLNTGLIKAFSSILPPQEFTYRLPNVLAHVVYVLFSVLIIWRVTHLSPGFRIGGILLLNCNPYMLDFFSLARGYGLALAFTMGAIYFWLRHVRSSSRLSLLSSLFFAALAVLSNFSLLNLYLGICGLYVMTRILVWKKDKRKVADLKSVLIVTLFSSLLFVVIKAPLQELVANDLILGGEAGFWSDTVMSLITRSTYSHLPSSLAVGTGISIILFMLVIIVAGAAAAILYYIRQGVVSATLQLVILTGLLVTGIIMQHHLFGTLYLIERAALFLLPIFGLAFLFSLHELQVIPQKLRTLLLLFPALIMSSHTALAMNLTHTLDWKYEWYTKSVMATLKDHHFEHGVKMGVDHPHTDAVRFYKEYYRLDAIDIVENKASTPYTHDKARPDDFFNTDLQLAFVARSDIGSFSRRVERVEDLPDGKVLVWFPQPRLFHAVHTGEFETGEIHHVNGDEFVDLFSDSLHKFVPLDQPVDLLIEADVRSTTTAPLDNIRLVMTIGPDIYRSTPYNKKKQRAQLYFNEGAKSSRSQLNVYLWNIDKRSFVLSDAKLIVFSGSGMDTSQQLPSTLHQGGSGQYNRERVER